MKRELLKVAETWCPELGLGLLQQGAHPDDERQHEELQLLIADIGQGRGRQRGSGKRSAWRRCGEGVPSSEGQVPWKGILRLLCLAKGSMLLQKKDTWAGRREFWEGCR